MGSTGDDRRVVSGIVYVIRNSLQWKDAQRAYGPHKMLYNRFIRWSRLGVFNRIFAALAGEMVVARALQGVGSAATGVLAVPIVRDCYSGRHMARVMSFAFIVFIAVPVIAPRAEAGAYHDRCHAPEGPPHGGEPSKKGDVPRCIGRTKGGLNSELHAVYDGEGRPLVLCLSEAR
jgi:transposase